MIFFEYVGSRASSSDGALTEKLAERVGFEPTVGFKAHVRFRVECLRPAQPSLHLETGGGCIRFVGYCKEQNHRPASFGCR